jgi:hypothetical protein
MGFIPFAGLLPQTGGLFALSRVASDAAKSIRILRGSFSNSAFLPVRAHVPFGASPPPRLIFVGVTDRLLEIMRSAKAIGLRMSVAFDFWASTPVCGPFQ